MRNCCLSLLTVSSLAAIVASAPAAASTQLCPGAALAGVTGPITNGSSCNLEATGTTVSEVFVGVSAKDTDILKSWVHVYFQQSDGHDHATNHTRHAIRHQRRTRCPIILRTPPTR